MNFVPINPAEAVFREVLAAVARPAWVVDADRGLLVADNGRGDAVWGVPVMSPALDEATIPALKALRSRLADRPTLPGPRSSAAAAIREALRFRTGAGARAIPCVIHLLDGRAGRGMLLVIAEDTSASRPGDGAGETDTSAFVERWLSSGRPAGPAMSRVVPPAGGSAGAPLSDAETLREIARRIRQGSAGMSPQDEALLDAPAPVPARPVPEVRPEVAALDVSTHLAHELRTPLAAIISLAEVITEERLGPWPNERYRAYVRDILDSARHGLEVVDGILREAPGLPATAPVAADVDLNVEVEALCASLQPLAGKSGARLEAALVSGLPRVSADRRNVRQMLLNLISNGIKHGGASVRIKVTTGYELGGEVWVEVEDDGPGMATAAAGEGALEKGARASGRPRTVGLGLPLTRALATANGARLDVSSRPGRGVRARLAFDGRS